MTDRNQTVVVGATSAMAVHCVRIWAQRGDGNFVLLGRDANRLEHLRQDVQTRFPQVKVETRVLDLMDPQAIAKAVAAELDRRDRAGRSRVRGSMQDID
jgi:short-subunit dehydrogenase